MKEAIAAALVFFACFMTGCAGLQEDIGERSAELRQEYEKVKKKYKELRPRLKRDFSLLFGTDKNGDIDPDSKKLEDYPEGGKPGIQDLVYSRFESFSKEEKKRLKEANAEAKKLYKKAKKIDRMLQEKGKDLEKILNNLRALANSDGITKEGKLKALTEFLKIAGDIYIKSQS